MQKNCVRYSVGVRSLMQLLLIMILSDVACTFHSVCFAVVFCWWTCQLIDTVQLVVVFVPALSVVFRTNHGRDFYNFDVPLLKTDCETERQEGTSES